MQIALFIITLNLRLSCKCSINTVICPRKDVPSLLVIKTALQFGSSMPVQQGKEVVVSRPSYNKHARQPLCYLKGKYIYKCDAQNAWVWFREVFLVLLFTLQSQNRNSQAEMILQIFIRNVNFHFTSSRPL